MASKVSSPQLPTRPPNVPEPTAIKLAVRVPATTNVRHECGDNPYMRSSFSLRNQLDVKIVWGEAVLSFEQEEGILYPCFAEGIDVVRVDFQDGDRSHSMPVPIGWTIDQARAAESWAGALLEHLTLVAEGAAVNPITLYAQAAGVSVWHDLHNLEGI